MASWRTTLGGICAAIGGFLLGQGDPLLQLIGGILNAAGLFFLGISARDNKVTSEKANAHN